MMGITSAMECDGCGEIKVISGQLPEDDDFEDGWTFDEATYDCRCPDCAEEAEGDNDDS